MRIGVDDVRSDLANAETRIAEARKALEPFAKAAGAILPEFRDDQRCDFALPVRVGDFRAACRAMIFLSVDLTEGKRLCCPSCDGTGIDLYDGTPHDCQVCSGRGIAIETSAVERYSPKEYKQGLCTDTAGNYVLYSVYTKLEAENERLAKLLASKDAALEAASSTASYLAAELDKAEAQRDEALRALEPLDRELDDQGNPDEIDKPDDYCINGYMQITYGDCRDARRVLTGGKNG